MVRFTLAFLVTVTACSRGESRTKPNAHQTAAVATFAGGCFWCVESAFDKLPGVYDAVSGYTGGARANPSYGDVSSGKTKHLEAVQVRYDPKRISYAELLSVFWRQINPTDSGGQFADRGHHYRTAIFVHDDKQRKIAEQSRQRLEQSGKFSLPIATAIRRAGRFYPAEGYHQDYHRKNPQRYKRYYKGSGRAGYIRRVWGPPPKVFRKPSRSELRQQLSRLQYRVTQQNGTERAFQNRYWNNKAEGIYVDIVSGEPLFSSRDKFKSGTGWPSFFRPLEPRNVVTRDDRSHGMARTEVRSRLADSHLGHLFHDGPRPTRLRYCINSAALRFIPKRDLERVGLGRYLKLFK